MSHAHADHFNKAVLGWRGGVSPLTNRAHNAYMKQAAEPASKTYENFSPARFRLILSDDIPPVSGAVMAGPGRTYELDGLTVTTLESNDEGVAFLVEADGLTVYHAGDLNWWHWHGGGESPLTNRDRSFIESLISAPATKPDIDLSPDDMENLDMAIHYKREIDKLKGRKIDLAFVPVDPRLENEYAWGLDYFMRTVGAANVFPMHFWDDAGIVNRLRGDNITLGYRDCIRPLTKRGESFTLE